MSFDPVLLAVAFGLVLLNAFFVAAEFSLLRVRAARVAELAQAGNRRARAVQAMQGRLEGLLSATQLGVTLSTLGLGWVGAPAVAGALEPLFAALGVDAPRLLRGAAIAIGFLSVTFFHLLFGQLVPKGYTGWDAERVALWSALPVRVFQVVAGPVLWLLDRVAIGILRLLGVPADHQGEGHSEEELRLLMAESHRLGQLSGEKRELLENVIDYTDRSARHVMIPRGDVAYLALARSLDENLAVIAQTSHTRFPLATLDLDHVVGMIHVKDLFLRRDQLKSSEDLVPLKRDIMFVPESRPLDALQRDFQHSRTHMAIVVDEYGGTSGLVTLEDVIEEIVGEIQDEFDREPPQVEETPHGLRFDGLTVVEDAWERLGIHPPEVGDVSTLGGFMAERLGKIPRPGDTVTLDGYDLTVAEMKGRRVTKVLAVRRADAGAEPVRARGR
jgi:CBS domain containing-hemolysin-like protein